MRYSYEGDVRPEYAAMSGIEAATMFAHFLGGRRDLFRAFETLCELRAVIDARQADEGEFDFGAAIVSRNSRPMVDLSTLYPTASEETA